MGEYTCKGAKRDVYLCTLRRRRELGQFVVKVGTTLLSHNASLSEVTLCRRGFTDGIAVCFYVELPVMHNKMLLWQPMAFLVKRKVFHPYRNLIVRKPSMIPPTLPHGSSTSSAATVPVWHNLMNAYAARPDQAATTPLGSWEWIPAKQAFPRRECQHQYQ